MKPNTTATVARRGELSTGVPLCKGLLVVLALLVLGLAGCTADDSSTQSRAEATAEGREAYEAGDYKTAYEELYPLAEEGDPLSQFYVARMYHFGEGRERDIDRAIEWYQRSAKAGAAPAQYNLGRIYDVEDGYRDRDKAIKWYEEAAENGNANAMHSLGYVYAEEGKPGLAFKWKKRAADSGSAEAQFDIALLYAQGDGATENIKKAIEYYRRSARQGVVEAMVNLAVIFDKGVGVERDLQKVYQWFFLADQQGWDGAGEEVEKLERALEAEAVEEARAQALAWRREHLGE